VQACGREHLHELLNRASGGVVHGFHWVKWTTGKPTERLTLIPAVKKFGNFRAFFQEGSDLAHGHLNDETAACD
jgi:hypothetical protein